MLRARGRGGVCLFASRAREVGRHAAGLDIQEVWRCVAGVLPLRCMKLWSFAVKSCRRGGVCLKRSGAREVRYRRVASICLKSPGGLEMRCRRVDVEELASRALEMRCSR